MIRGVHIARYRGIRELVAEGFGRVNLIIGKNDCGKTAFMEALRLADDAEDAAYYLMSAQETRLGRGADRHDFDRFWRPIFFDLDAEQGLSIEAFYDDGISKQLELRQGAQSEGIRFDDNSVQGTRDDGQLGSSLASRAWALDLQLTMRNGERSQRRIVATPTGVTLPPFVRSQGSAWIGPTAGGEELNVKNISVLKQRGQDAALVDLLREVDGRLLGIEILAPGGNAAELFVRLSNGTPMLPVALMGDGVQRCLEFGAAAAARDWPALFIDEIENGMHHLVLEPIWRWIASVSRRRDLQIFATTHSEECIHAACRAFRNLQDEDLRVIRLDRLESGTRATVYDRALIEVAERTGTEIRG